MAQQDSVNAHERQLMALDLRKAGMQYAAIAQQLNYRSAAGAFAAVRSALKRTLKEPADELRQLEVSRLDAMLAGLWIKARKGDNYAIDRVLRIMERRAKLLGLDKLPKVDMIMPGGEKVIFEVVYQDDNKPINE
jgi:hypothetical protein